MRSNAAKVAMLGAALVAELAILALVAVDGVKSDAAIDVCYLLAIGPALALALVIGIDRLVVFSLDLVFGVARAVFEIALAPVLVVLVIAARLNRMPRLPLARVAVKSVVSPRALVVAIHALGFATVVAIAVEVLA